MQKFINLLLGTNDIPTYMAALVFALVGAFLMQMRKSKKRNKNNAKTPAKFNFWFMVQDNLKEIITGLLLILLALRFSVEYAGTTLTMFYALGVGIGLQRFSQWLTNIEENARK